MTRIVVLGADGFIGKHLVLELSKDSNNKIIAFDRFSSYQNGEKHIFESHPNIEIVAGNFFNRTDLENLIQKDDYVFHLISSTNPANSNDDPYIDIDTNIRSSIELFEICANKKIKKIIFSSSGGAIYGDINSGIIDEATSPQPRSPYAIGKLTIENYLRYFKFTHGLSYMVYRVANPYGPGQNIFGKQGVIPIFMHKFLTKNKITIFGDGEMVRDYIYIDDLIYLMASTYNKNNKFNEYNIGSGDGKSVNQIVSSIEKCVGFIAEKKYIETPATYIQKSVLDTSRFIEEFNIVPKVSLDDGIRRTWDYVKSIENN